MKQWMIAALAACSAMSLHAETLSITVNQVSADGVGDKVGTVSVEQTPYGLVFRPSLQGLQPGIHGFHIHTNPSCDAAPKEGKPSAAEAAGGHWDPNNTGKHGEPWGDGHLGDLPALYVTNDGKAEQPVLAPRLKNLDEIKGHALMLHAGGDNHADHPMPLGGGGARVACGVIK
ncbi:superoxide dismutase [Pseudomonas sp. PIC25]|uniref:superoxide dismutase family protein n=1 Tax=Pseudomonas sp. PIC25 TaxID=1958773 RepID=UPI000BABC8D6|nr:superoxide dismutase family protein [Pseudomonas sp. PIC25]PAU65677.1 superoxide dismutase [Pseudomonas sp. PIC25]